MSPKSALSQEVDHLKTKLDSVTLPPELKQKTTQMLERLTRMADFTGYSTEYDRVAHYISWIIELPWDKTTTDRLDLKEARAILDKHHYGMNEVKERIIEYLAVMRLTQNRAESDEHTRAPIICL
ncbi:TPA: hypothetical protein DCK82_01155, partial [Candidatus Beckwithbacteria bacterium]|nr:hypothetical protein [Candidatus Beckwithbacteria bacterium]